MEPDRNAPAPPATPPASHASPASPASPATTPATTPAADPRPFAPEIEAELGRRVKKELRKSMQRIRSTIPAAARRSASVAISARLAELGLLTGARGVALFRPIERKGEVDTAAIDALVRDSGGRVAYPLLEEPELAEGTGPFDPENPPPPPTMSFRWVDLAPGAEPAALEAAFEDRGHGFPEPRADAPRAEVDALDVVIVPALAFDPRGHRIGYGAGFYDRFLAGAPRARALGVCFDFQVLAEVPTGPHDAAVGVVVTDKRSFAKPT